MAQREERYEGRYEIDGVTYESLDDVPQPYRDSIARLMADGDGDGVPDVFDRPGSHGVVHRSESYEVDGVTYSSIDEIPEPQRSMVRRALADAAPPERPAVPPSRSPAPAGRAVDATAAPPSPIVTGAGWSKRTKLFAGMIALDVVVAGVVLWFVLR